MQCGRSSPSLCLDPGEGLGEKTAMLQGTVKLGFLGVRSRMNHSQKRPKAGVMVERLGQFET